MTGPDDATIARFRASLDRHEVSVTTAPPATLGDALCDVVEEPAVAAPLPFEELALPDWLSTDPTPSALEAAQTGVTAARFGVADYGSVALAATPDGTEPVSLFPERHVVVLRATDVVEGMTEAMARVGAAARAGESRVLATGPSATADMGELVVGAHGPAEVHLVLVESDGAREETA